MHIEVGPAIEGIAKLAAEGVRWDLAFIDADKTGYLGYYKQVCQPFLAAAMTCGLSIYFFQHFFLEPFGCPLFRACNASVSIVMATVRFA